MSVTSVIVHFGGLWLNGSYHGGDKLMLIITDGLSFQNFQNQVHSRIGVDQKICSSSIMYLVKIAVGNDDTVRLNITNDIEFKYALDTVNVRNFYVNVSAILTSLPANQSNFVNLLNSQHSLVHEVHSRNHNVMGNEHIDTARYGLHASNETNAAEEDNYDVEDELQDHDDEVSLDGHDSTYDEHNDAQESYYDFETEFQDDDDEASLDGLDSMDVSTDATENRRQWVIPCVVYQASLGVDEPFATQQYSRESLHVGAMFDTKDNLIAAIGMYHLNNKVEYVVDRSSTERYYVICKHHKDGCKFRMRAVCPSVGSFWRVTHSNVPHTCEMDLRYQGRRTLCAKVIGSYFAPRLMKSGAILRPKDMAAELQTKYGFQVDYSVALAGRNYAIRTMYGDYDESFQLLPSYLHKLRECNPGSYVAIQTDSENIFEYSFMALGASVKGFLSCGRPIIVLDATHLKGKYKGVVFVATSLDGNEQLYPLAFGIGDKENNNSWIWFIRQLKRAFGCPNNLLFIFDQHVSISKAVEVVYPGTPHGLCVFHMQKNLAKYGENVVGLFKLAAYSYKTSDHDKHMSHLEELSRNGNGAYSKLIEIGPCRWSRSYCPVRRFNFLTSNYVESMNNALRWARRLSVCTLLEFVRSLICHWFVERRRKALEMSHELTNYATMKLENSLQEGQSMEVEPINTSKFNVRHGQRSFVVDLSSYSCSCRQFDIDLIPCSHAAAAICKSNESPISYVSPYYKMDTLREMYSVDVNPIGHYNEWEVPEDVKSILVRVPNNPRQAGRPRNKRIPSRVETSSSSKKGRICSRCKGKGHYRATCNANIPITSSKELHRVRRQKHCSMCQSIEHTKKKCHLYVRV